MDYAEVLKRTWEITWRRKSFWLLGLLAGCSASGRGGGGGSGSGMNYQFDGRSSREMERFFGSVPEEAWISIGLVLLCVALLVFLVFFFVGVFGQAGLIAGFAASDEGESVSLSQAIQLGRERYWTLVGIRILFALAAFVVVMLLVMFYVVFGIATLGVGLICLLPMFCLLIPLALAADAYTIVSMVAAVEEKLGVLDAFRRAWEVIKQHVGPFILMTLLLVVGGTIIGFIMALPFIAVFIPLFAGLVMETEPAIFTGAAISVICLMIALPVFLLFNSVLTTYITGAWTTTYRRLTGKSGAAELAAS